MELLPYSIYTRHRPFRIAFLVDTNSSIEWINSIMEYNKGKWGGRFNAIIFTDGKNIEKDWWKFLRDFDPDIIKSTVNLEENLLKKIQTFLSPLLVEQTKAEQKFISISEDPLDILPTAENIRRVGRSFLDDKDNFVLFEIDESTPEIIKNFLNINFGLMETGRMMTYHVKKSLEGVLVKKYKITDFKSLNETLLELGEFRNRVVFPIQICSLPNFFKDTEYSRENEKFTIIIGDTINELTYYWNRTIGIKEWMRTDITQLWLPEELVGNEDIQEGLGKFINRYTGQTGNNDNHGAHFVSFSIEENKVKEISQSFNTNFWRPRTFAKLDNHPMPSFGDHYPFYYHKKGYELYRANTKEEHLIIDEPNVEQGGMGGQKWFIDLYIQYHPEKFKNIVGVEYWWQLPRRNYILTDLKFFNRPARINKYGMFSVLMGRRTEFNHEETALVVKIPEDSSVFRSLICGEKYDCYTRNDRDRFLSRPFYTLQKSDKGRYLAGVLSLFPDLFNAHHFVEERFWRNMFEKMSNHNSGKDINQIEGVKNIIKKSIERGHDSRDQDEYVSWLAQKVFNLSKSFVKKEVDLIFNDFVKEAKKETAEYNKNEKNNNINFDEEGLKDTISDLIEQNIILVGIKPRCPRCGYRIWYHLNEVTQHIVCKGCGYNFTTGTEEVWHYRLNSLVRSAFSLHGTIPVLLTLGQIMSDARSSFLFTPSVDLFNKDDNEKINHYGEIDLLCLHDGQFIIGEIKQSVGLFDAGDFEKLEKLALLIKPDVILFSSLDKEPNRFVKKQIKELQKKLNDLEIKVQWYPLHYWIFNSGPVI